jgi:hypothetical protein
MILALVAAALAVAPGKIAYLADYKSADQQAANARDAARIGARLPKRPERAAAARAVSWQIVGRLHVDDPAIVDSVIRAYSADGNAPAVRASAAWAMGELGRGLPWDARSRAMTDALLASMSTDLDPDTAYSAVEALGKLYPQHEHTPDEDLAAAKGLNALAARQTTRLPAIYYVVQQRVLSLEVAVRLLRDVVVSARQQRDETALAEAYSGALSMVRYLGGRQDQLSSSYAERRVQIGAAFDGLLDALELEDRRVVLMVLWSLGEVAEDPVFAELVAERMAPLATHADPSVRLVVGGSLARLDSARPAREALRAALAAESDDRVLRLLHALHTDPAAMDVVQRLFDVAPRP